ncbi:MAG: neutral/alkaline non-lysosomal ceramidase N-terminal domain-containing protein [Cytophagales bacterium]|nr:neutral/alkaline non-lysosomal ceramidase N-terminal domain-containing protein [Cytophagales bacterium]
MLRKIGWSIIVFVTVVALLAIATLAPINYNSEPPVEETLTIAGFDKTENGNGLEVGWSAVNITPEKPTDMAGYGPRGPYCSIADSLFSRTLVFDNGLKEVVIISLDLIMFPREIRKRLEFALGRKGFSKDEIFLSATHTHNGFGNFDTSIGGQFAFGEFNTEHVNAVVKNVLQSIEQARQNKSPATIGFQKIDAGELVINRLMPKTGKKDPFLRILHIQKTNGERGMLISFSGHATNLDADVWEVSRDYPGVLIDNLEDEPAIDFAIFCAGMVGSHNIDIDLPKGPERIKTVGDVLTDKIMNELDGISYDSAYVIGSMDLNVELGPSQLRISRYTRLRNWVFEMLFDPLEANIKVLQIDEILFLGMPCDYSGELSINNNLDKLAESYGKKLFITSFNGNYVGYITEDKHYNSCKHDEVMAMNWVGPNHGKYFTGIIKRIIKQTK